MSILPEDLYLDILLMLPVKSLLKCMCVCKSWFSLISDPSFVKSHHDLTVRKNNPSLVLKGYTNSDDAVIHSINYDSLSSEFDDIKAVEIDYPFRPSTVQLVGSCNGLVCIWIRDSFFCIWNPATNEYKRLPESSYHGVGTCGFGYDYKTDDYKLVCVVDSPDENNTSSDVEVYTLGSNSWKSIQTIPYWFSSREGVHINGALHWLGTRRGDDYSSLIISFETNGEKINDLQLPKETSGKKSWKLALGMLKGCLCVLVFGGKVSSPVDVWVMQDYGVRESWTKMITVHGSARFQDFTGSLYNGKIILFSGACNLYLSDPEHGSAREVNVCRSVRFASGVQYFETLVSLSSGGSYFGRNT